MRLTSKKIAKIKVLAKKGFSITEIAKKMRRARSTVFYHLNK